MGAPLVHALKVLSGTNRPIDGTGGDPQLFFNIIQQFKSIVGVPVHLIDKRKNRDVAHYADLEQFSGLGLHTLGSIDHHHRGIRSHQCAVSVLREILMPRRIQNIDAVTSVIELQHGRGNRNTSLLLNLHPVRHCMTGGGLSLYGSSQIDGAPVEQKFLRQSRLTGIGMGNDRKGAPLLYFIRKITHAKFLQFVLNCITF